MIDNQTDLAILPHEETHESFQSEYLQLQDLYPTIGEHILSLMEKCELLRSTIQSALSSNPKARMQFQRAFILFKRTGDYYRAFKEGGR